MRTEEKPIEKVKHGATDYGVRTTECRREQETRDTLEKKGELKSKVNK